MGEPSRSRSRGRTSVPQYPFTPTVLESRAANLPAGYADRYYYRETPVRQHDAITDENQDNDFEQKLARLRQSSVIPKLSSAERSYTLPASTKELQELFLEKPGEIVDELVSQLYIRRVLEQQIHMYRQIAADALAEGDTIYAGYQDLQQEKATALAEKDAEIRQLRARSTRSRDQVPPAPSTQRATRFTITPNTRDSSALPLEDSILGPRPSAYPPATPLASRAPESRPTRSAKFPDPPLLSDGQGVTFEQWKDGLHDKLRANRDWYIRDTPDDTEETVVAYIRTRTEGSAHQTLSAILRTLRNSGTPISREYILDRLEKCYGVPHHG